MALREIRNTLELAALPRRAQEKLRRSSAERVLRLFERYFSWFTALGVLVVSAFTELSLTAAGLIVGVIIVIQLRLFIRNTEAIIDRANEALSKVTTPTRVRNGGEASKHQIALICADIKSSLSDRSATLDVYEMNLEREPPQGVNEFLSESELDFARDYTAEELDEVSGSAFSGLLLPPVKSVIERACIEPAPLQWTFVLGDRDRNKKRWHSALLLWRRWLDQIAHRDQEVESVIDIRYTTSVGHGLNYLSVPELRQAYVGYGEWLGPGATGGIWVKNQSVSAAVEKYCEQIADNDDQA